MAKLYKMVAVNGDMGPNGMANTAKVIQLSANQVKLAREWIDCQNTFQQEFPALIKDQMTSGKLNPKLTELLNNDQTLTTKMFDLGIFAHKYDARTSWTIVV
jgi:hypothetical protein